jgi:hypothetical protein
VLFLCALLFFAKEGKLMSQDYDSLSWPHCPIHLTNLQAARAHGLPVWLCGRCLAEHTSAQQPMPLEIYQIRPGVLTRYNRQMEQERPETAILPDLSPGQLQRLADDIAAVETSRVPRVLHRKRWQRWQRLLHREK